MRRGMTLALLLALAGAVRAADDMRVLATFDVGENTYVRALTVDAKRNVLWVGTSSGVTAQRGIVSLPRRAAQSGCGLGFFLLGVRAAWNQNLFTGECGQDSECCV